MGILVLCNYIFIFLLGLCLGSFLNCVIYRLYIDKSFLKGRSHCPHCKHLLHWRDLLPVASFVFLQEKCRYCKAKISWQYPAVELAAAVLLLTIAVVQFPETVQLVNPTWQSVVSLLVMWYLACAMLVIFVYDLKNYLIPDKVLFPAIAVVFFYQLFFNPHLLFFNALLAALGAFTFFFLIFLVSKGKWMGFGDVKLVIFLGLLLGFPNIVVALFAAFFLGSLVGLSVILISRKGLKSEMPFAPFLLVGTWLAMLWGPQLISWYINLFTFNV